MTFPIWKTIILDGLTKKELVSRLTKDFPVSSFIKAMIKSEEYILCDKQEVDLVRLADAMLDLFDTRFKPKE